MEALAQHFVAYVVDYIRHECLREHAARFLAGDTAALHVEEGALVELACGGAVACLDFIAIDFELRRGVHAGLGRHEDIAVGLRGVGVAGFLIHYHAATESAVGLVEDGGLEELFAGAVLTVVAQGDVVRYYLAVGADGQAAEVGIAAVAEKLDIVVVGSDATVELCGVDDELGVVGLRCVDFPFAACGRGRFLDVVDFYAGALGNLDVDYLTVEVRRGGALAVVA